MLIKKYPECDEKVKLALRLREEVKK